MRVCPLCLAATAALLISDFRMSVTVDLHVTCVSAAPLGSRLEVESTVEQAGKSILFTSCRIFTLREGGQRTLVATGVHTKKVVAHLQMVSPKPKL
jgi:acyl-coenzyme A thioesterase PaaI-like protein